MNKMQPFSLKLLNHVAALLAKPLGKLKINPYFKRT